MDPDVKRRDITLEDVIRIGSIMDDRDEDDPREDTIPDWRDRQ
jgi:hypothetical protein